MEKSWEQAPQSVAASDRIPNIIDEEKSAAAGALRKRNFLRCCSCVGAALFFVVILAGTLIFTVFRVRGPALSLNSFTIVKLQLINGTNQPQRGSNATLNADVSMKNRNFVSFRHPITTSTIYYRGVAIGEVRTPAGNMPALRTTRMNVTADIIMDRVVAQPDFGSDMKSGSVQMSWYTRVGGRAKFFFIKKHVTFKMNCTATVNVTTKVLQKYKCKPSFKL